MTFLLSVQSLAVARGPQVLASDINCRIEGGTLLLLTGPNGSGKTSFLRTLAGLLPAAEGTVERFDNFHFLAAQPLAPSLETPRQYLNFQAALMYTRLSVEHDPFSIASYLDTPLNKLSTGWRQRVKLTKLVLQDRKLWLLDEPTDGLDTAGVALFQKLIQTHLQTGGGAVIATHDPHLWPSAQTLTFGVSE